MRFRDYLSFKDIVIHAFPSFEVEFDRNVENSVLFTKCRIEANPKGYYFILRRTTVQKDLDPMKRKYFEQCVNHRSIYSDEKIESMIKSIDFPNIKITDFSGRLMIDSLKSDKIFIPKSFFYIEEYTVKFDDLSYLVLKELSR